MADTNEKKRKIAIDDDSPVYVDVRDKLNEVGPGFCLAKWTQVTMHLQLGHTHSCHHPSTHQISLKELKRNPTALHNTNFKKRRRKEMLEGKRPSECLDFLMDPKNEETLLSLMDKVEPYWKA